jgi:excisionase family DNA binding protein
VFELSFDVEPVMSVVERHVKLSKSIHDLIVRDLVDVLSRGAVQWRSVGHQPAPALPDDLLLTTEQAAQLAGVSRPHMVKLIDSGAVELHQMVGNRRRVLRSAVARWQGGERVRQARALARLSADLDEEMSAP